MKFPNPIPEDYYKPKNENLHDFAKDKVFTMPIEK